MLSRLYFIAYWTLQYQSARVNNLEVLESNRLRVWGMICLEWGIKVLGGGTGGMLAQKRASTMYRLVPNGPNSEQLGLKCWSSASTKIPHRLRIHVIKSTAFTFLDSETSWVSCLLLILWQVPAWQKDLSQTTDKLQEYFQQEKA